MNEQREKFYLKLSPNARLRMTLEQEMLLDPERSIFNDRLRAQYLEMHKEAVKRQEAISKTLVYTDIALAMLLFGKNIKIPGLDIGISDIPFGLQAFALLSSISFLFLSYAFLNSQLYHAIIEIFDQRDARSNGIDPDFITSATVYTELWLKVFRKKMNFFGVDFYEASKAYLAFFGITFSVGIVAMLSLLLLHLSAIGYALWITWANEYWWWIFAVAVVGLNVGALMVNALFQFSFGVGNSEVEN